MRLLSLIAVALLLGGCEQDARVRAEKTVKRLTERRLRLDAALFYKNIYAARRMSAPTVNREYWSEAFAALSPLRIVAYDNGLALTLERIGEVESGLYIVPLQMDNVPTPTTWASYEKLSEGIYWYTFRP